MEKSVANAISLGIAYLAFSGITMVAHFTLVITLLAFVPIAIFFISLLALGHNSIRSIFFCITVSLMALTIELLSVSEKNVCRECGNCACIFFMVSCKRVFAGNVTV